MARIALQYLIHLDALCLDDLPTYHRIIRVGRLHIGHVGIQVRLRHMGRAERRERLIMGTGVDMEVGREMCIRQVLHQ